MKHFFEIYAFQWIIKFHQIEWNNPYLKICKDYSIKMCKDYSIKFDGILLLTEMLKSWKKGFFLSVLISLQKEILKLLNSSV